MLCSAVRGAVLCCGVTVTYPYKARKMQSTVSDCDGCPGTGTSVGTRPCNSSLRELDLGNRQNNWTVLSSTAVLSLSGHGF
jgi:hypothetical protein